MNDLITGYAEQIDELAAASRRLGELGYVTSHGGNLSFRVSDKHVLITPTKVVKRKMRFEDIVLIDMDGKVLHAAEERRSTGETPMHLLIYKLRPDLIGLVHAHPPILTGFSISGRDLLARPLLPEPVIEVGPVVTIPYAEPISDALALEFESHVHKSNAWLMRNHGITIGSTEGVERALDLLEMTEAMAQSVLVAEMLGEPEAISADEVANLEKTLASRSMPRPGDPRQITTLLQLYSRS